MTKQIVPAIDKKKKKELVQLRNDDFRKKGKKGKRKTFTFILFILYSSTVVNTNPGFYSNTHIEC